MNNKRKPKSFLNSIQREIQNKHLFLIVIITILLSVGGAVININANSQALDQNLRNTADLISRLASFTNNLSQEQLTKYYNSICDELPNVDVISIVNTDLIRVYHTNNSLIGTKYDGKIPDFTTNSRFTNNFDETGPSGPQRRTYCPIYDKNSNYCGFIMTIILKTSIYSITKRTILLFLAVTIIAILIEFSISHKISEQIKQKLLGYEPDTFTSMFTVRDDILNSINDGIISLDANLKIQFINKAAKQMIKCPDTDNFEKINLKLSIDKLIKQTIKSQKSTFNIQKKTDDGTELLIDCVPSKKDEKPSGAVLILHDRTEYTKLMEDLSGTKYLVDSMRANNHDFTNKLHVILGLIQIGQYDKAISYIENISIIQRETLSKVINSIENPSFAALLIGKIARASECNVKFILKDGINFRASDISIPSEALVTIVGNLIDNALDAMNTKSVIDFTKSVRELIFGVYTKPGDLLITVEDTGSGISDDIKDKIFENGFSTKGTGRGIGLYHTKQLIENLGGTIMFESQINVGTSFIVNFKDLQENE